MMFLKRKNMNHFETDGEGSLRRWALCKKRKRHRGKTGLQSCVVQSNVRPAFWDFEKIHRFRLDLVKSFVIDDVMASSSYRI